MRVIAGTFRSRTLLAPQGRNTRPTSDRLRETLFNVLAPRIPGAVFLDLYAGTGAVGIEAFSRGAAQVYFAETGAAALGALRANLRSLGIGGECVVEARGALPLLRGLAEKKAQADIVFLDPPYQDTEAYEATLGFLARAPLLRPQSLVVVERSVHGDGPRAPANLKELRVLRQGDALLGFYALQ
jgi:16S rRNA (guanine(966)-N(2))-methyltransferase RsmD